MARLIDADAVIKELDEYEREVGVRCGNEFLAGVDIARELIVKAPTIDAEPVRHGRWINGECSECGEHAPYWSMSTTYYKSPYCYLCGAKMDLEVQ